MVQNKTSKRRFHRLVRIADDVLSFRTNTEMKKLLEPFAAVIAEPKCREFVYTAPSPVIIGGFVTDRQVVSLADVCCDVLNSAPTDLSYSAVTEQQADIGYDELGDLTAVWLDMLAKETNLHIWQNKERLYVQITDETGRILHVRSILLDKLCGDHMATRT